MWLILTDHADPTGPWLAQGLTSRGLGDVEVVTTMELLRSAGWCYRIGLGGAAFTATLANGRVVDSEAVTGIVNRIQYIPPAAAESMTPPDQEYYLAEQHGFFLAWLASYTGPILNPPTPRGLSGAWRPATEWACLAASAGLEHEEVSAATPPQPASAHGVDRGPVAITVDSEIVDTGLDDDVRSACLRLASVADTPVLGIHFTRDGAGRALFAGATPCPDLIRAGDSLLDAFAYRLAEDGES